MAWRMGVDEAGYGPNLGPLVMTAVSCRLPDELAEADLWHCLKAGVRRERRANDLRLRINDSKLVYSGAHGLAELETTVLSFLGAIHHQPQTAGVRLTMAEELLGRVCPAAATELAQEVWYHGRTSLPMACPHNGIEPRAEVLRTASAEQRFQWGPVRTVVVCPGRFNELVDHWDSKAAILGIGLGELLRAHLPDNGTESLHVVVDKHGGRNHYSALVQEAVGAGMTLARFESADRSVYEVTGLGHPLQVTFKPRADAGDLCVALASMISKYVRELLMAEFNEFWRKHLPDLTPTAGYPVDAGRFFADIEPVRRRLQVADRQLWRQR